jgi:hypothetical protein
MPQITNNAAVAGCGVAAALWHHQQDTELALVRAVLWRLQPYG